MPVKTVVKDFPFQTIPIETLANHLSDKFNVGYCLSGGTGSGKTYVIGRAIAEAQKRGHLLGNEERLGQPYSVLILAPKACITQHTRAFNACGVKNFLVTNYDSLRTDFGEIFMDWQTIIKYGEEHIVPNWNRQFAPDLIVCDESQMLKNSASQRGLIHKDYVAQRLGKVIYASATHFAKACEAEYAILGCGVVNNPDDFTQYSWAISPNGPTANSPTAVARAKEDIEGKGRWIPIKGVKYPFKPMVSVKSLPLIAQKREYYNLAYERFRQKRREAGKGDIQNPIIAKWNAMREFQMCCELLASDEIATIAAHIRTKDNNSIIYGSNFVQSLKSVKEHLLKLGIPKEEIAELHGGVPEKLGQKMIDDFQDGSRRFFLTTLKKGGTGLSLNHDQESSFPRTQLMRLPWSIYEAVQFLGRAQRISNLSPVKQFIITYEDTIEDAIKLRLQDKLSCVSKLMDRKDSFIADIFNGEADKDMEEMQQKEIEENEDEEMGFDISMLTGE